jgi:hypothetical protein
MGFAMPNASYLEAARKKPFTLTVPQKKTFALSGAAKRRSRSAGPAKKAVSMTVNLPRRRKKLNRRYKPCGDRQAQCSAHH